MGKRIGKSLQVDISMECPHCSEKSTQTVSPSIYDRRNRQQTAKIMHHLETDISEHISEAHPNQTIDGNYRTSRREYRR